MQGWLHMRLYLNHGILAVMEAVVVVVTRLFNRYERVGLPGRDSISLNVINLNIFILQTNLM